MEKSRQETSVALGKNLTIGGQALIEGVMMRSPSFVAFAVRKKNGSLKTKDYVFHSLIQKYKLLSLPILRGMVHLIEMMVIGFKALNFSAQEYADEKRETSECMSNSPKREQKNSSFEFLSMIFSFLLSLVFAFFLFKFIPLAITEWLRQKIPFIQQNPLVFNLIDGMIRIAIFFLYIAILSFFKSFQRIFEYHGAEHMAIHAYEKGAALTKENVLKEHPEHPRCGTSFLLIVFIASILLYTLVPRNSIFWINLAQRLAVIPLIAGVGYELLKWSAKYQEHALVKLLVLPGMLTQKITTKRPADDQIEVAIAALQRALELEQTKSSRV